MPSPLNQGVSVVARPFFLPEQSDPRNHQFVFGYEIRIQNESGEPLTLKRRRWEIRDGFGRTTHVEGEGVVGKTPLLEPSEAFTYQSFCPLPTDYGFMRGAYTMETANGDCFEVEIAPFVLMAPWMLN